MKYFINSIIFSIFVINQVALASDFSAASREHERRKALAHHNDRVFPGGNFKFNFTQKLTPKGILIIFAVAAMSRVLADEIESCAQENTGDTGQFFMGLGCYQPAHELGSKEQTKFSELERAFAHPGIYVGNHGINTAEQQDKIVNNIYDSLILEGKLTHQSSTEESKAYGEAYLKGFAKVFEIDGSYDRDVPVDGTNYRITLDFIETEVLNKPFASLKTSQLIELIKKTNGLLTGRSLSEFRNNVIFIKTTPNIVPSFDDVEAMIIYLQKHDTRGLKSYQEMLGFMRDRFGEKRLSEPQLWMDTIGFAIKIHSHKFHHFVKRYYHLNDFNRDQITAQVADAINEAKLLFYRDPIKAAALLHHTLARLLAFSEATGRTARIWVSILLKQASLPAFIGFRANPYEKAVTDSIKRKNPEIFESFLRDQICKRAKLATHPDFANGVLFEEVAEYCGKDCQQEFNDLVDGFGL